MPLSAGDSKSVSVLRVIAIVSTIIGPRVGNPRKLLRRKLWFTESRSLGMTHYFFPTHRSITGDAGDGFRRF